MLLELRSLGHLFHGENHAGTFMLNSPDFTETTFADHVQVFVVLFTHKLIL